MNDDDLDPRDELASAYLDGATTPAEADAVVADPELVARIAAFEATRDAIRDVGGAVDDARREAAIAAALAAYDETGAGVTPIASRRRPTPRWLPAVGVAAAALLAALLIPLLTSDDDGDDETDVAAGATTTADADLGTGGSDQLLREAAPDAPFADASGGAETGAAMTAPPDTVDLGAYADVDALAVVVRERLATPPTTAPGTPAPIPLAEAELCLDGLRQTAADAGATVVLQATAVVDDQAVVAAVQQDAGGAQLLVVVELDGCEPVATLPL